MTSHEAEARSILVGRRLAFANESGPQALIDAIADALAEKDAQLSALADELEKVKAHRKKVLEENERLLNALIEKDRALSSLRARVREVVGPFAATAEQIDQIVDGARSQETSIVHPVTDDEGRIAFPVGDEQPLFLAWRYHDPHPASEAMELRMCHLRAARQLVEDMGE